MELMARYPDKHFELSIVDPEYGIGESGKNHKSRYKTVTTNGASMRRRKSTNYTKKDWDSEPAGQKYFKELFRVSKNQIISGANYFEGLTKIVAKPPRRTDYNQFILDNPIGIIIWDKVNGNNDFSDCEIIYTSFNFPTFIVNYMWAGMNQGRSIQEGHIMQGNKSLNEKRIHPTQKPVALYKWLLDKYAKEGDKILDTHLGSASIAIACHDYGFELTACELDIEYYLNALKRIGQHQSQYKMF